VRTRRRYSKNVRQNEYDILARNWEYAETAARQNRLAQTGLPTRMARQLRHEAGDELAHPVSQTLFLRLQLRAAKARSVILVCDDNPDTAAALYATLATTPSAVLTVVCREGSASGLKRLLLPLTQSSQTLARLRVVEASPSDYLTRLTPDSYDAIVVSGRHDNYTATMAAAATLLHQNGLLLLTDMLASANNPAGGVAIKVDRGTKTVAMRALLADLQEDETFDSVLLPIGTGLLLGLRR
jgi:hypothetical protein